MHVVDVWHFEYFRVVFNKEFSLYLGTDVWEALLLRAALAEPCILHGVVALGALSRNTVPSIANGKPALSPGFTLGYSLRKYNQAIQELNNRLAASPSSWQLAIVGSMIFIAIESLQGNYDVAETHLRGSLKILQGHGVSNIISAPSTNDMAHVLHALSRIHRKSLWLSKHYMHTPLRFPVLPSTFTSISEARDSLNSITGTMNTIFWKGSKENQSMYQSSLGTALVQCLSKISQLLESWQSIFDKFIASHFMDTKTTTCVKILFIHYRVSCISALTYANFNQSAYDAHVSDFSSIVDLATEVLEAEHVVPTSTIPTDPSQDFGTAIVQPLSFVACECRDDILRQRAIALVKQIKDRSTCDTGIPVLTRITKYVAM
jgi:hypothetical protein